MSSRAQALPLSTPARPGLGDSLSSHLRAWLRIAGIVGSAVGLAALRGGAAALAPVAPARAERIRRWAPRAWARWVGRMVGMRLRVEGALPDTPHLLVANHLSYVDVVALWSQRDGLFVAKSEVASWPLVGALGRFTRTLFIDRKRKRDLVRVLGEMRRAFAEGQRVILFPEGTSSPGSGVLPFKSSLFEACARTGVPVVCASLSYATADREAPAHLAVCWWGDMTFPDHIYGLLRLRSFEATLRVSPVPLWAPDRKELARSARSEIQKHFVPVVEGHPVEGWLDGPAMEAP